MSSEAKASYFAIR